MNSIQKVLAVAALAVFSLSACADEAVEAPAMNKPSVSGSRTVTLEAEVTAINHETREVTLSSEEGTTSTLTVSDAVRNLDQVNVGDEVVAQLYEELSIRVFPNPDGLEPGYGDLVAGDAAELGEKPGAMAMDTVVITAVVEALDKEAGTYALRGPEGNVTTFEADNPANLQGAEVGDLVVLTVVTAVGILVETPSDD